MRFQHFYCDTTACLGAYVFLQIKSQVKTQNFIVRDLFWNSLPWELRNFIFWYKLMKIGSIMSIFIIFFIIILTKNYNNNYRLRGLKIFSFNSYFAFDTIVASQKNVL